MKPEELFSKRFTELVNTNKYTLEEIGLKIGIKSKGTISKFMSGEIKNVKRSHVVNIANLFNVSPAWLAGLSNEKFNISSHNKQAFPILGMVKAGYNYLASENIIGVITIDEPLSDPENYYALKIVGDSMQPILFQDDIVIVHQQNDVENGQIAIILIDDEEATIKKVIKTETGIRLEAFNPYYPPREFTYEDIKKIPIKIIGKVTNARISKIFEK